MTPMTMAERKHARDYWEDPPDTYLCCACGAVQMDYETWLCPFPLQCGELFIDEDTGEHIWRGICEKCYLARKETECAVCGSRIKPNTLYCDECRETIDDPDSDEELSTWYRFYLEQKKEKAHG